jgi:hypothetical protein
MAAKFTVYTAEAIEKIHRMKLEGKKSPEIARAIGTTTNSLTARMSQLGISKRAAGRDSRLNENAATGTNRDGVITSTRPTDQRRSNKMITPYEDNHSADS